MTLWECNACKKTVKQNDYDANVGARDPKNLGWAGFTCQRGTKKKPVYVEVHLCPDCLKKIFQYLGAEW